MMVWEMKDNKKSDRNCVCSTLPFCLVVARLLPNRMITEVNVQCQKVN